MRWESVVGTKYAFVSLQLTTANRKQSLDSLQAMAQIAQTNGMVVPYRFFKYAVIAGEAV